MMMKMMRFLGACLLAFVLGEARAQTTYGITVTVDDATLGDIDLLEGFLATAADGQEVSKSLRRIAMAAVGEVTLAVDARIDENDAILLDDGSTAVLYDGDVVDVEVWDLNRTTKKKTKIKKHAKKKPAKKIKAIAVAVVHPMGAIAVPPETKLASAPQ